MLMREGFPPALLPLEWRTGYMHGLYLAQTSGNHTPICNLIGRAVEQALDRYLERLFIFLNQAIVYWCAHQRTPGMRFSTWPRGWIGRTARGPNLAGRIIDGRKGAAVAPIE
jgi:hypothetical protein